jgi:hypothetical protein
MSEEDEIKIADAVTGMILNGTTLKIGDRCYITENAKVMLGLPDGIEFTIKDILQPDIPHRVVLNADEFGKDWIQFFKEEELIKCLNI